MDKDLAKTSVQVSEYPSMQDISDTGSIDAFRLAIIELVADSSTFITEAEFEAKRARINKHLDHIHRINLALHKRKTQTA